MISLNDQGLIKIPSEFIEDKMPEMLSDWLRLYWTEKATFEEVENMMLGFGWFLSKNGAIHAQVVWNNETDKIKNAYQLGVLRDICQTVFSVK